MEIQEHSKEVHNSRRPLDHLTLTLTLTFDLIFVGGRGIVTDYPCAKFGDFSFSRFGFIVRTHRQNHRGGSMLYATVDINNKVTEYSTSLLNNNG